MVPLLGKHFNGIRKVTVIARKCKRFNIDCYRLNESVLLFILIDCITDKIHLTIKKY